MTTSLKPHRSDGPAPLPAAEPEPVPVAVELGAVEDPDELREAEDMDEDVKGLENDVDGGGVGNERDVLVAARAQNCSTTPSAADRSLGHDVEMHPTRPEVKRVALRRVRAERGSTRGARGI